MTLKNLSDEQIKKLLTDQEAFMADKKNQAALLGFDSATKRRFADILKYEMNLSDDEIKAKIDAAAMIRLKEIDVFS
jgi:hypothetical protein